MALRDVVGHDKPLNILQKTIQRGRIPSSYLFAGESGIGKKLTAVNLAKALNCVSRAQSAECEEVDACDECSSCRKIDAGIHPDFSLISPESSQIRVEEIRAIGDALSFKAFEGRYKVVIVDDADTMNQYAANAFLKTLEEPPENSLIILISSKPERLPDTIRSRCSRINFAPLSQEESEKVIRKVFNQQKSRPKTKKKRNESASKASALPDSLTLSLIVRLAMGRPGNAISPDLIEERTSCIKLLDAMLNTEKDGWASREEMEKWFDFILILLRDMAAMKITSDETELINIDLKEKINRLSNSIDLKVIIEYYHRLNALKGYFNFNLNKSLIWNYTGSVLRNEMDMTHA